MPDGSNLLFAWWEIASSQFSSFGDWIFDAPRKDIQPLWGDPEF